MNNNILNKILIEWNDSGIEDSGLIKVSDVKDNFNYQLTYKLDEPGRIKIFDIDWPLYDKYKNNIYMEGEHIELLAGSTIDLYLPGEYKVYIENWYRITDFKHIFTNCKQLTSVIIPNLVTEIGDYAFFYCINLTSIIIPDKIEKIGERAFFDCRNLKSVIIPNLVTEIGDSAFCYCTGLTSIRIPKSIKLINQSAFQWCDNLKTIYVEDIKRYKRSIRKTSDPTNYGVKLIELKK